MRPWRRFIHRPRAVIVASIIGMIVLAVVLGPDIYGKDPNVIDPTSLFKPPTPAHPFGTDEIGRDLLARCLYGGRLALGIALGATVIGTTLGTVWGLLAGFRRGWIDQALMRSADTMMAIPEILVGLMFIAAFGASIVSLTVIIGLILVPITARVMRSALLSETTLDYYLAAVASGASAYRILSSELFRNTSPTLLARVSLAFATAIVLEASLSFLGLGVQPPLASWGSLVQSGYAALYETPTYFVFPGVLILVSILSFNFLADEVQVILDPRS